MGINRVFLLGYVGIQPKIIKNEKGTIAAFSIGTMMFRNNKNITDWHKVEARGTIGEFIENYVEKGDLVMLEGYLMTTKFKNKMGYWMSNYFVQITHIEMMRKAKFAKKEKIEPEPINEEPEISEESPF